MKYYSQLRKLAFKIFIATQLLTPFFSQAQLQSFPTSVSGKLSFAIYDVNVANRIYATDSQQIFVTEDAGTTWRTIFTNNGAGYISHLKSTATSDLIYFTINSRGSDETGLYRLNHKTGEVTHLTTPNHNIYPTVSSYDISDNGQSIVVYTSFLNPQNFENCSEVYRSANGGESWDLIYDYKDHYNVHCNKVAINPSHPDIIYLTRSGGGAGVEGGLYISTDAGKTWSEQLPGKRLGPIAFNPFDSDEMIVGIDDYAGQAIYISFDRGMTWSKKDNFNWKEGLVEGIKEITYSPSDPNRIYIFDSNQLFLTTDKFNSCQEITPSNYLYGYHASINPANHSEMLVCYSPNYTDEVGFSNDGCQTLSLFKEASLAKSLSDISTGEKGIYFLDNDNLILKEFESGKEILLNAEGYTKIFNDPSGAGDIFLLDTTKQMLSFADFSSNNGEVRQLKAHSKEVGAVALCPTEESTYLISIDGLLYRANLHNPSTPEIKELSTTGISGYVKSICHNESIGWILSAGSRIYVSKDPETVWTEKSDGLGKDDITTIASSPFDSNLLIAASDNRIYISSNGAKTWEQGNLNAINIRDISFSPISQGVVVAGAYSQNTPCTIYFSNDNGETWHTISSKELHYAHASAMSFEFATDGSSVTVHIASLDMGRLSYEIPLFPEAIVSNFPWTETFECGGIPTNWKVEGENTRWEAVKKSAGNPSTTPDESEIKLRLSGATSSITSAPLDLRQLENPSLSFSYTISGNASLRLHCVNSNGSSSELPFASNATNRWVTASIPLTSNEICNISFEGSADEFSEIQIDNISVSTQPKPLLNEIRNLTSTIAFGPVAKLEWTAPEGNYNGIYNVYRDNEKIAERISDNIYSDSNFAIGKHTWTIKTIYEESESNGASVESTYTGEYSPVRNLTIKVDNNTKGNAIARLSWDIPDNYGEGIYNVYCDEELVAKKIDDTGFICENIANGTHLWSVTAVYNDVESERATVSAEITNYASPVRDLKSSYDTGTKNVTLSWKAPGGLPENYICHSGKPTQALTYNNNGVFRMVVAVRWTAEELKAIGLDGAKLTQIAFVPWSDKATYYARLWIGGNGKEPGAEINVPVYRNGNEVELRDWNTFDCPSPITIDANEEIWIGYQTLFTAPAAIIGCDAGPEIPGINMIYDGEKWHTASAFDPSYNANFCIAGCFETPSGRKILLRNKDSENISYNIYRDEQLLTNTTETTFEESDLPEDFYTYKVSAVDPVKGESFARTTTLFAGNLCPEAENIKASVNAESGEVILTWDEAEPYYKDTAIFEQHFDDKDIPKFWTIIDKDGDGECWHSSDKQNTTGYESHPLNGRCMVSESSCYINENPEAMPIRSLSDHWLISPSIELPDANVSLHYNVAQLWYFSSETEYEILVSTNGTDFDSFTTVFSEMLGATSMPMWIERNVDLSAYKGKTIHIAFRHHCNDLEKITIGIQLDELSIVAALPVSRKYNIYRDNSPIAFSVTGNTFSDKSPVDGKHIYSVRTLCEDLGYESHPSDVPVDNSEVTEINLSNLKVYPNPTANQIYLSNKDSSLGDVTISDTNGRIVYHQRLDANFATIETSTLSPGIYILKIANVKIKIAKTQ